MWWHRRRDQNGRVDLNRRGRQFSRLVAAEVCASAVVMLDTPWSEVVWRVLANHSIRQFPLHFPSRASPCAITFQLDSTRWSLTLRTGRLTPRKEPRYSLNRRMGGPQSPSGHFVKKKKISWPYWDSRPGPSSSFAQSLTFHTKINLVKRVAFWTSRVHRRRLLGPYTKSFHYL